MVSTGVSPANLAISLTGAPPCSQPIAVGCPSEHSDGPHFHYGWWYANNELVTGAYL